MAALTAAMGASERRAAERRPWPVRLAPSRLDFYLLKLMLRPMLVALVIALAALLTERILRMFSLVVDQGAALRPVLTMFVSLTPHYLGLALPAAFCIGMIATLSALSRGNELDAIESAGWSLRRIGAAFVGSGLILAMLSILLFGFAQPYARYAFREARHAIVNAGWAGTIEQDAFVQIGDGMVLSAGQVDATGRVLGDVFMLLPSEEGESAITARRGVVVPEPDLRTVRLMLEDGVSIGPGGALRFETMTLSHEFDDKGVFRPRGATRELTLAELSQRIEAGDAEARDYEAELHGRLVRALSLVGIALMSVPLGVVGKRAPGWPRMVVALVTLAVYHNALTLVQDTTTKGGGISPAIGLWAMFGGFMLFAAWLYLGTSGQGERSSARRALKLFERPARAS
ncbi:MAG: LptF/LptG family permease [Pseudomonadota bacterium]